MSELNFITPETFYEAAVSIIDFHDSLAQSHGDEYVVTEVTTRSRPYKIDSNRRSTFSPEVLSSIASLDTDKEYSQALLNFEDDFLSEYGELELGENRIQRFINAATKATSLITSHIEKNSLSNAIAMKLELSLSGSAGLRLVFNAPQDILINERSLIFSDKVEDDPSTYVKCASLNFAREFYKILISLSERTGLIYEFPNLDHPDADIAGAERINLFGVTDALKEKCMKIFIQSHDDLLREANLEPELLELRN